MYEISIKIDEMNVKLVYSNYARAIFEFKDCVHEVLKISKDYDNIIMKIDNEYAICILQNDECDYKVELRSKKGDE